MQDRDNQELPKIDPSALPELDCGTGLFGSLNDRARLQWCDDNHAISQLCLYSDPLDL